MVLNVPDDIAQFLIGWLEDQAESHYPLPEEITDEVVEGMVEDIVHGRAAAPIDILGQKEPPVAWLLAQLYDAYGWPKRFDDGRRVESKRLIDVALVEAMDEQKGFLERTDGPGWPD